MRTSYDPDNNVFKHIVNENFYSEKNDNSFQFQFKQKLKKMYKSYVARRSRRLWYI